MDLITYVAIGILSIILYLIYLFCLGFAQAAIEFNKKATKITTKPAPEEFTVTYTSKESCGIFNQLSINRYLILDNGCKFEFESVAVWNEKQQAYHALTNSNRYLVRNGLLYKEC